MSGRPVILPLPEPRGLSRVLAAAYLGIGSSTFDELVSRGQLPPPIQLRGRKVWDRAALDRKLDELSGLAPASPEAGKAKWLEKIRSAG